MQKLLPSLAVFFILAGTGVAAHAQGAPAADVCRGCVDPYDPADQRAKFFKAAGVDNELDAAELAADAQAGGGFAQKFDSWEAMKAFDKNGNGTIDWFEADEYRQAIRKRVMAAFDHDHSGTLTGGEREAANAALAAGKLPADAPAVAAAPGTQASQPAAFDKMQYDKDGDGKLSPEERAAMMKDLAKRDSQAMIAKYDKDGDGKLNDEERKAMQKDQQGPLPAMFEAFSIRNFDANGDGVLDEQEKAAAKEFQSQLGETMKNWQVRFFDADGDGKVSDEERKDGQKKFMMVGLRIAQTVRKSQDANGDGVVSPEEMKAFNERMGNGIGKMMQTYEKQADADGDGRLSPQERQTFLHLVDQDFQDRVKRFDADGDGRLAPREAAKMADEWFSQILGSPAAPTASADEEEGESD